MSGLSVYQLSASHRDLVAVDAHVSEARDLGERGWNRARLEIHRAAYLWQIGLREDGLTAGLCLSRASLIRYKQRCIDDVMQ